MTESRKIAERTGRRTISIQTNETRNGPAVKLSLTPGTGPNFATVVKTQIHTNAEAETRHFNPQDEFIKTRYGYLAKNSTKFGEHMGADHVYIKTGLGFLDPDIALKITAEAETRPDGPIDVYLDDERVEVLQPGESTEVHLGVPGWQKIGIPITVGIVGIAAVRQTDIV